MLTLFRRFAKSWVATVLIGLIAISFVVVGTQTDILAGAGGNAVIKAGSREISREEFRRLFENVRAQAEQQAGRPVPQELAVQEGLHMRLLDDLALTESFAELLRRMGLIPADGLVGAQIRKTPVFFNPVSGAFDREAYTRQLQQNGLTEAAFEGFLRDDLAQNHYVSGAVAGLRAPRLYGAVSALYEGETRSLTYYVVDPRVAGTPPPPTDAQLQAFLKENAAQLTRPEARVISLVRFSAAQQAAALPIDDAEVRKQFEFRKDSLSEPERRTFVQVAAPNQQAATQIAARLRAGEDPAAVARAFKAEPVRYDNQPRTAVVDRRAAAAAFGLPAAGVAAPFQGDLGWAVVRVETVTPGRVATLEQARPAIEAQLRQDAAAGRVLEQVEKYEEATQGGQTLAEAARALGATIATSPPITQRGTDVQGRPLGLPEALLTAAFELPAGGESDLIDAGQNEFFALRVDRVIPASVPPLAEIRTPLAQAWTLRETVNRARARADALAGQSRGANARPIEAVAASAGATVGRALQFERDAGGQTLSADLVAKAFAAKRGDVIVGEHTQLGFVVARVDNAAPPTLAEAARTAEDQRPAVTVDLFQAMGDMARTAARATLKTRVFPERARQALGLPPEDEAPSAPPQGAPAAKS
jgi:peptidyl-prolyl cis-trans isomerase D